MLWNDLSYEIQLEVIDKFGNLMLKEQNEEVQFAMAAAIVELEMWSNSPCSIEDYGEEGFIAEASDRINL